jgi:Flp pilus assembly pilin Flp
MAGFHQDQRGAAMAEYLIISSVAMLALFYLYNPNNGLFQAVRAQYNTTATMLVWFGP